jgi:hypothetical protein
MSLSKMFDTLTDAGFVVSVNAAHTVITAELTSRKICIMEVEHALGYHVNRRQLHSNGNGVTITE